MRMGVVVTKRAPDRYRDRENYTECRRRVREKGKGGREEQKERKINRK